MIDKSIAVTYKVDIDSNTHSSSGIVDTRVISLDELTSPLTYIPLATSLTSKQTSVSDFYLIGVLSINLDTSVMKFDGISSNNKIGSSDTDVNSVFVDEGGHFEHALDIHLNSLTIKIVELNPLDLPEDAANLIDVSSKLIGSELVSCRVMAFVPDGPIDEGSDIEPDYNWVILSHPDRHLPYPGRQQINTTDIGFSEGKWSGNIDLGLVNAFYLAMQYIQLGLVYRIHMPQDLSWHTLTVKIAAEQRVMTTDENGLPKVGDVSFSPDATTGLNNMSTLVKAGLGELYVYRQDFSIESLTLDGIEYLDMYFISNSTFIVATNLGVIGEFVQGFGTNIIGVQMARLSRDGRFKGDIQHVTVEKLPLSETLITLE